MTMERGSAFTFHYLSSKTFDSLECRDSKDCLMKWSMLNRIKAQAFSYDQTFQEYQRDEFVLSFFQDPAVSQNLEIISETGKWVPFGCKVEDVTAENVTCSLTSMSFFDRLYDDKIVRSPSGMILKCFEEYCDDIPDVTIDDELKRVLLVEDSLNFKMFNNMERQEFLFLIFKHFCIGGSLCQYEDQINPYLNLTRSLYKDLIGVQKDPRSGQIVVTSFIYKVTAKKNCLTIYPSKDDHFQNFAYLCINPMKKHIYVLYHKYGLSLPEVK